VWEELRVALIDALSHVEMVKTQASINVMMGTCLTGMVAHHNVMWNQDFNVLEGQLIQKTLVLKYVVMEKTLIKG
jgi:hypothetical protein